MIKIDDELKELCPSVALGIISFTACVENSSYELKKELNHVVYDLEEQYQMEDIAKQTHIKATRQAYLKLGKSPSEYRNAAEAMLRRIVKGKGLYQINNVVEINNIVSIKSGYSIGSYDLENIKGQVVLKKSKQGEKYQGIGKDLINIENLPTLYDNEGPFGNPTSDSRKAMIQLGTRNIMMVIYSFDGKDDLLEYLEMAKYLLNKYTNAKDIKIEIV